MLGGIEFFVAAVETGSFAKVARRFGVTPSAVSRRIAVLETELGTPLLARTTRALHVTNDGRAFYERCVRILEELREARDALAQARNEPRGVLRVDAPAGFGRHVLAKEVPKFLARYPEVRLELSLRDQYVDPIAEGIDVLLRIGPLGDSSLIAKRLGECRVLMVASPKYLRKHGRPKSPAELALHNCMGYLREWRPEHWLVAGAESVSVGGTFHANDADLLCDAALSGVGIAAVFDFFVADRLREGSLVRLFPELTLDARPLHALYPRNRHLLPKVRAFLEMAATLTRKYSP